MGKEPLIRLSWQGRETIETLHTLMDHTEQIEIILPIDYNHALFHTLHPDAAASELEDIDASGGPELLAVVASINGLEEFASLTKILTAKQARVQVISPPKVIIHLPSPARERRN